MIQQKNQELRSVLPKGTLLFQTIQNRIYLKLTQKIILMLIPLFKFKDGLEVGSIREYGKNTYLN